MKKPNKKLIPALLVVASFTLMVFSGCVQPPCEDCDITCTDCKLYENHDISACGVKDPLRNIGWLRDYCKNFKSPDSKIDFAHISLYKVINRDEYVFGINYYAWEVSSLSYSLWKDCSGNLLFDYTTCFPSDVLDKMFEEFISDKEFVTKIFDYGKQ